MTSLLTYNLPLLAGAPNGIKKLRELILELAVRGKLVPQDPNDEPATKLLKRISEEKARLVAESRLKKQKPLGEIDEQAQPFELPLNWVWTRLGEITNFGNTTKKDEIPDDAWVLDLEDIEKDTSRLLQKSHFHERNSLSDKNSFTKGDVLYGKLRPYLNKVLVAEDNGFCTTEILPFRCHGPFVAHYFTIALKSPYFLSYVNAKSYGMKMPRLGTEDGRQAFFPLPPLAEQHRIVAKVDELMALCDRLEAQQADAESAHAQLVQALLDSLTQASDATDFAANWQRLAEHFHTLFTTEPSIDALKQTLLQLAVMGKLVPQDPNDESASELLKRITEEKAQLVAEGKLKKQKPLSDIKAVEAPFELPISWTWARFGNICAIKGELVRPEDFPSLRQVAPDCIEKGTGRLTDNRTVKDSNVKGPNSRFFAGQIVYSKIRPSLSKAVLVDFDGLCSADMYPIDAFISSEFLLKEILSEVFLEQVRVAENRIKMPKLNQESLTNFVLPIPPLAEQHRIVAKIDQLMALCDQLKARMTQTHQLNEQLASTLVDQTVA